MRDTVRDLRLISQNTEQLAKPARSKRRVLFVPSPSKPRARPNDTLVRELKAAAAEALEDLRQARAQITELKSTVRSEQTRRGQLAAELEAAQSKLSKLGSPRQDTTLRNLERRENERIKELDAARQTVAELRAEVDRLRAQQPAGRGVERRSFYEAPSSFIPIRTSSERDDAAFNARAIEYQRRLVDEGNLSFEGAATANALELAMHHGEVSPDRLICSKSFQNAFYRGGLLDNEREAEANRADPALWSFASDSQKGTQMMVYFKVRCCP